MAFISDHLDTCRTVTVLLVTPDERDHISLRHLFDRSNWVLHRAYTFGEARSVLEQDAISVVITEQSLGDRDWGDVLHLAASLPRPPQVIVACRAPDTQLWAEVLNTGGYDVLVKPWEARELFHVVGQAWLAFKQHDVSRHHAAGPPDGVGSPSFAVAAP